MRNAIWNEDEHCWTIAPIEALAQAWHNVAHEGFLDVGPMRIASHGFVKQQERNAFDLGVDCGRGEAGMPPAPVPPQPRHLHAV